MATKKVVAATRCSKMARSGPHFSLFVQLFNVMNYTCGHGNVFGCVYTVMRTEPPYYYERLLFQMLLSLALINCRKTLRKWWRSWYNN